MNATQGEIAMSTLFKNQGYQSARSNRDEMPCGGFLLEFEF